MSSRTTLTRTLRALTVAAVTAAATLTLAACTTDVTSPASSKTVTSEASGGDTLAALGLEGADARTIIDALDALPLAERPETLFASVRPDELLVTDGDADEESLPMPDDAFYVSFAPYDEQTHDCYFHSLTTCTGEIQNEDVHVTVTDEATGEVLIDEVRTTFDNGFVGLWLPRGIDATLTVEYDGRSASTTVSTTNEDDATCITTMRLA